MGRWQATTEIVKSFNAKGKHGYAFAALFMMMIVPLTAIILLSLTGSKLVPSLLKSFGF